LETPLHLASYAGLTGQIRLLKERGVDVEARTKEGETAADLLDGMYR
jgi:ankyrin repeat protein